MTIGILMGLMLATAQPVNIITEEPTFIPAYVEFIPASEQDVNGNGGAEASDLQLDEGIVIPYINEWGNGLTSVGPEHPTPTPPVETTVNPGPHIIVPNVTISGSAVNENPQEIVVLNANSTAGEENTAWVSKNYLQ